MPKVEIKAAALVTIPNIPIVSTGTYHLASGMTTFTEDHLRAAVAAQDDPAVTVPRLKIGHESDFGDGEPCFGKVLNMYLGDNDQTIYGDYVGVPAWLAEIMPSAYPARSIEGAFDAVVAEGKPPHALLITAVSLLGVVAPGVSTLEDLPELYGEKAPEGLEIVATTDIVAGHRILAKAVGGDMPKDKITAAVSVDDVRREFYDSLDANQSWWWITRIEVDPMQLIVDDEEGGLWRVPYDPSGEAVTFSDPVAVEIVYVDVGSQEATAAKAAIAKGEGKILAAYNSRSDSRPDGDQLGDGGEGVPKAKAKSKAAKAKQLRASLGLAEDATDQQVAAALKEAEELLASGSEEDDESDEGDEDEDDESEEDDESTDDEDDDDDKGDDDEVEAGTVTVDKATLAELKKNSDMGVAARKAQLKKEREDELSAAVKAGKFPRARKGHWRNLWKNDPEGTREAIAKLEPNLVPVEERGSGENDDVEAGSSGTYDPNWLSPAERQRIAAANAGAGAGSITTQEVA